MVIKIGLLKNKRLNSFLSSRVDDMLHSHFNYVEQQTFNLLLVCVPQAAINSLAVIVIVMIISELLLSASEQVKPL